MGNLTADSKAHSRENLKKPSRTGFWFLSPYTTYQSKYMVDEVIMTSNSHFEGERAVNGFTRSFTMKDSEQKFCTNFTRYKFKLTYWVDLS